MLSADMMAKIGDHQEDTSEKQVENKRRKAANAAVLTTVDMNAVNGVGEPSYTSGAQKWNGAAATLNARPAVIMSTPP